MANSELTFGLVHGSWHGAWCWQPLQAELKNLGYPALAMDLPIDDPEANFEDYAETVIDCLSDEPAVILVGHSRAGNVIPRAARQLAVQKLIYLCASFEPTTIGNTDETDEETMPHRNSQQFLKGIHPLPNNLTAFDKQLAKEFFFHDCPKATQEWAANQLRPQRRGMSEPSLTQWPETPQAYIVCSHDRVVRPEWSQYAARNWLQIEPIEFPSGHSPFLAQPQALARLLVSLANDI